MTIVPPVTPVVTSLDLIWNFRTNRYFLGQSDEQQHRRRPAARGKWQSKAGLLHQSDIDCAKCVQTSCRLYCLRWCCLAGAWHDTRRRLCRQCCLPGCLRGLRLPPSDPSFTKCHYIHMTDSVELRPIRIFCTPCGHYLGWCVSPWWRRLKMVLITLLM